MWPITLLVGLLISTSGAAHGSDTIARGPTRPAQVANLGPVQDSVVRSVPVKEGDRVRRGDAVLHLVDDVQSARIKLMRASAAAEGELRQAEVQAREADSVLARTQAAASRTAATEWEVRQARARLEAARALVQIATDKRFIEQQKLELELATIETLTIRAPFDGLVTRVETTPGATLLRTDRPLIVADLSSLEAVLYLPAAVWPKLRIGKDYQLTLSPPVEKVVTGHLRHVDPLLDAASGRFRAVFVIDNPDNLIPAGVEAAFDFAEAGQ